MFFDLILLLFVSKLFNDARTSSFLLLDTERWEKMFRSVYKELHADHETGAADNKTGWISSTGKVRDIQPVLLSGVSKGVCPLAHDFARKV